MNSQLFKTVSFFSATTLMVGYMIHGAVAQDLKKGETIVGEEHPPMVSMISLIATPEKYQNKKITTLGYVSLGFEANGIYVHQEDVNQNLLINGLWLDSEKRGTFDVDKVQGKYCIIEATFRSDKKGHFGMWSGTLTEIKRLEVWTDPDRKPK